MDSWNPTIIRPCLFLPLFILLFFASKTHFIGAADSISTDLTLSGNQTIMSGGGNFELGFFSPGQSRNYYIGIWFRKDSQKTAVWVANREMPLPDTSSVLKISEENGNLVLVDQTKTPTWSSNSTSIASNSTIAVLLDSGNLVLRDRSNSSLVFWQSFDHPTDTWLPDNKIGLNKINGLRQRLVSWRSSEDPAPGAFSFQMEEDQYFLLWNNSRRYWISGLWDGYMFSSLSELPSVFWDHKIDLIDFTYSTNEKENYFSYSKRGRFMRMVLGASGRLSASVWANETENWIMFLSFPNDQCSVYALCGPFGVCDANGSPFCTCLQGFEPRSKRNWEMGDWSSGCSRENDIVCADNNSINREKVVFQGISGMQLPANPKSLIAEGVENCKAYCLDDCSCTAYSYNDGGCFIWYGDLLNLRRPVGGGVGGDFYLRLSATSKARKAAGRRVVISVSTTFGFLSFWVIVSMLVCWRRRRKLQVRTQGASSDSLVVFRYRELQRATKNFTEKLGGGSFGSVFKGTLPDSSVIAVKKLEGIRQGEKQFRSEVSTIGNIQHVNLVRLRGFCPEGTQRLLVYDYMLNGSLSSHLFEQFSNVLSWKTRYQIALGIARGLAYLHEECRECILHCDIKPENILLDSAFCPKVADFGMAKLLGRASSRVLTTMRGTIGYLAPEWILGMAITAKADVYSYGMLVLEMISGRRNYRQREASEGGYFPAQAASKVKEGDVLCLLDHRLEGEADVEELNKVCRVACWCIQEDETIRPSMGQVVRILEGVLEVCVPPIPGFLQYLLDEGL